MKKYWIWPALAVAVFVGVELSLPKPLNWTPTYSQRDKNPYGSYALARLLPDWFAGDSLRIESRSFYELDTVSPAFNYLVLANGFSPDSLDGAILLDKVSRGATVLIASQYGYSQMWEDLGLERTYSYTFDYLQQQDSVTLRFSQGGLEPLQLANDYMSFLDSLPAHAQVLATVNEEYPVLVRLPWGKGQLLISTLPKLFTNYYLVPDPSRRFARYALGFMPNAPLWWTEYYHLGRPEARTPLRFILSEPALRWAYYLGLVLLLGFMLFGIKRKQRAIPVLNPPANTSLQFAHSLGRLYYRQQNHIDLAQKRLTYLMESLREYYHIGPYSQRYHSEWVKRLAGKSGQSTEEVEQLLKLAYQLDEARAHVQAISAEKLLEINRMLEKFRPHKN